MKKNKQGSKGGGAVTTPLDPSTNAEDFFGDPTGLTGITKTLPNTTGRRLSPDLYNDEEYDKSAFKGMSSTRAAINEDIASESDATNTDSSTPQQFDTDEEPYLVNKKDASGNDAPGTDYYNTSGATYSQPEHLGEQSVSGSAPDPTADDDTLAAAQAMGTQLDEDEEHPKELNIAGDIDKAEESIRTH